MGKVLFKKVENRVLYRMIMDKKPGQTVQVRSNVSHIWIFDRSGSMWHNIDPLVEDMIAQLENIADGDTLTLGWFSTEGLFNWIFKGLVVHQNKQQIADVMRKHKSTVALTCFSDILNDTAEHVITDLHLMYPGHELSLMFFTDGYPVVNNTKVEVDKVMSALSAISPVINSVLFVGYGDYYNKELMAKMAQAAGGILVHSSHIKDFSESLRMYVSGMSVVTPKVEVKLPTLINEMIFSIDPVSKAVVVYPEYSAGVVLVPESVEDLWVLTSESEDYSNWYMMIAGESYEGLIAAAYIAINATDTELALDLLGKTGDVYLIESTVNSWTNAEYGVAQTNMLRSLFEPGHSYIKGLNFNYLPDPGAFCLLDALGALMSDPNARFYPRHPDFVYKRTGVKTKQKDGYPEFKADENVSCPFNSLTWNSKRLNLSVLANISGTVDLGEEADGYGLDRVFKTFVWRNYTLVKDGILNVTVLPSSMSEGTFDMLKANGMIDTGDEDIEYVWTEDAVYPVRLDAVPLVNRNIATAPTAVQFCSWLDDELFYEASIKYLKAKLDEVDPDGIFSKEITPYSPAQEAFLLSKGINDKGCFSPQVEKEAAVDYYLAKEFEVKIGGFSSLPKISDVMVKSNNLTSIDKLTPVMRFMADVMIRYNQSAIRDLGNVEDKIRYAQWLKQRIDALKRDLKVLRNTIQETRFAVLLCKRWFPDLKERDGATVNLSSGRTFTFSIRDVKVEY